MDWTDWFLLLKSKEKTHEGKSEVYILKKGGLSGSPMLVTDIPGSDSSTGNSLDACNIASGDCSYSAVNQSSLNTNPVYDKYQVNCYPTHWKIS